MSDILVNSLQLPVGSRVDQRVPKKLLVEQGAPTAADKRQINDGVEDIFWIAALKPTTIGVPAFHDDVREYLEIAVLTVTLRVGAKAPRLIELVHRAIPYPLVLFSGHGDDVTISLAHKRWSQGERGQTVTEEVWRSSALRPDAPTAEASAFLASLALSAQPSGDLFSVYQGWMDRLAAFQAATITGAFEAPATPERAAAIRSGLVSHARLQRELASLRSQAAKEKQINRRVDLNLQIKTLEAELLTTADVLKGRTR